MATFTKFEDIEAWQKARILSRKIHPLEKHSKFKEDQNLKWQNEKSSGSIMDNIAEGFERGGKNEFVKFLSIAKGSAGETRSQLYRLIDQEMIGQQEFKELFSLVLERSKMNDGLMSCLKRTEIKGIKYK